MTFGEITKYFRCINIGRDKIKEDSMTGVEGLDIPQSEPGEDPLCVFMQKFLWVNGPQTANHS